MRVEVNRTPNSPRATVRVVKSYRVDGQPRKRIVRYLGVAHDARHLAQLIREAEMTIDHLAAEAEPGLLGVAGTYAQLQAARQAQARAAPPPLDFRNLQAIGRVCLGFHDVYGSLYEALGFHRLLPATRYRASAQALFHTVMARLANPASKRRNSLDLAANFGIELPLEKVYRMMDQLTPARIETLQRLAANAARAHHGGAIDVVLFDCTTLYFESFQVDALRQPGYSKDAKFKESQVLMALMVTHDGLPLGYELLPGATFEGHSLIPALTRLQQRLTLRHVVCVADRGMLSQANLDRLAAAGMHYVVGAKLKRHPLAEQILQWGAAAAGGRARQRAWDLAADQRLVVSYAPARAQRDAQQRARILDKLPAHEDGEAIGASRIDRGGGSRRYLKRIGTTHYELDADKIAAAARWDGLHGVVTNLPAEHDAATILSYYRDLWQVESVFRVTKHDLKIRPIYHWTEPHVHAHVAIAFMTLTLLRHLMRRLDSRQQSMSAEDIRIALTSASDSLYRDAPSNLRFAVPDPISDQCATLYRTMGVARTARPYLVTDD